MVNDVGMQYGAGIAHGRLAAGLDMAGHDVKLFDLRSLVRSDGKPDETGWLKMWFDLDPI